MKNKLTFIFVIAIIIALWAVLFILSQGVDVSVLNPKGWVALQEKNLIITAVLLMSIVVVPVYILTFLIAWKYRASNASAVYDPDHDHDLRVEIFWWAVPITIILILGTITWKTTHELDPFRHLDSNARPLTVYVVALNWKWLFIYPEQGIATVNFVEFPENRPIDFWITADTPMNSFWIPSLGSQIYAMAGMTTQLHLIADQVGTFNGLSANFSGEGFSGMKFVAQSVSQSDFDQWVHSVQELPTILDADEYVRLAAPSSNVPTMYFGSADMGLYNTVVLKYMTPNVSIPAMDHDAH
ncbi:ubiquinol oxidase subunit II [Candidatus Kaiserbacteria bacterium]|nr:ubiquinol oxidase subunit II [Candidatus Kaiserbacteria bacterium]